MNKDYLITPNDSKLYNYYWDKIKESADTFEGTESLENSLRNFANNTLGVKMLSPQMTNELCKTSVYTMLVEILRSSNDIGYALEFLKTTESGFPEINNNQSSYTNKLITNIKKTLSISLTDVTGQGQVINIDKLKTSLKSTVNAFYDKHPEYRGSSRPIKELQNDVTKVFDEAFEIRKTLKSEKPNQLGY